MSNELAPTILDLFGAVYRNLVRDENDAAEPGPDGRSAALSVLRRAGVCTMTDLSCHLRVAKPNVTFLVDKLEEQGLVAREADPADRRKTFIRLTPAGKRHIERKRAQALERVEARLSALNAEDRRYVEEKLPRIMEILAKVYRAGTGEEDAP